MRVKPDIQITRVLLGIILGGAMLSLCFGAAGSPVVRAQAAETPEPGDYYTVNLVSLSDGVSVEESIINGPPVPPPGFEIERQAVSLPEPDSFAGINVLTVPAFNWVFGCSAVSGAMIAGYYDRSGWPNIYTGPTNGGLMPLTNASWPTWTDGIETYPSCPLIASKNGVDGRTTRGSIDDYWVSYGSSEPDPYITNGWPQHIWGTAIGDYMKTSQSKFKSTDGSTWFYNYLSASRLTCATMVKEGLPDGTLGRKLFYEDRGYTVTDCYNQKTDNIIAGGFSFAQFKTEIDAGRPVMINLYGHTVVGVGYDSAAQLVYIHDTWDYGNHIMTWGGSYVGLPMLSVSIVNIKGNIVNYTISGNAGVGGATLTYSVNGTPKTATADDNGLYSFTVPSGWAGTVAPSKDGYTFVPDIKSYTDVFSDQTEQNYTATNGIVIGGAGDDFGKDIAVDSNGNIYIVGYSTATWGTPLQAFNGGTDGNDTFVAKLDSSGNLVWNRFLQKSKGFYEAYSIGVDGGGNVYVLGVNPSGNTYLVKLGTSGNQLFDISVTGGSFSPDMAVTTDGNIYIAGSNANAYAVKLDANGNQSWNTSLVRSDNDCATGLVVDISGNAYVTSCSHETVNHNQFVSKLDANGNLIWNTFLGDSTNMWADIAMDAVGSLFAFGDSNASWGTPILPYSDASPYFIAKLNQTGGVLWNTFTDLQGNDMEADTSGKVYIAGTDSGAMLDSNGNLSRYPLLQGSGITTDSSNIYTISSLGAPANVFLRKTSLQDDIFLPHVASIVPASGLVSNASYVDFAVVFSEPVTGVDISDFKLTNTLLTGASIVDMNGSGAVYTVTVNTGTGNGTIRLDIRDAVDIHDLDGNAFTGPYVGGQRCTIDKGTAPTVPLLVSPADGALVAGYKPTLDWNDSSPVMALANNWSYEVNVTSDFGYDQTFNTASGLSNSSYTFSGSLPSSTTFTWKVRAYNDNNQYSAWSAARTFRTGTQLGTPILILPANSTTENNKRPTFTWSAISRAESYTLQILNGAKVVNTGTIKAPACAYTPLVDLLPATTYTWRVKANNGSSSGEFSDPFTFTTSTNPPEIPMLLSPANKAIVSSAATQTFKWNIASGSAASYEVEYATNAAFSDSVTATTSSTELPLTAGSLLPNRTYYWHVRSWSEADTKGNHSYWSAMRTFSTKLEIPVLNLPVNGSTLNNTRPTFDWDEVPGATTYTLQVVKDGKAVITTTIKVPAYVYTPTKDLLPGTTYTWKVKANGTKTNGSDYSALYTFTTSANPPKVPVLSAPANGVLVDGAAAQTLKWRAVLKVSSSKPATTYPAAASYEVEYATNAIFFNSSPTVKVNAPATETSSITLLPGRTYYWRVRSWSGANGTGNHSAWSKALTIKVKFVAPVLDSVTVTSGSPTFVWHSNNGLWKDYTLLVLNSTTNRVVKSYTVRAPYTTYTLPAAMLPAGTYKWQVKINGLYTPVPSAVSTDTFTK